MTWEECLALSRQADPRYGLSEEQRRMVYTYAMAVPAGGVLVELGVCHGPTSIVMAAVAQQRGLAYHGVDLFVLENTEAGWRSMMDGLALPYTLHVGDTATVPWDPATTIDLLLIDASHNDPAVSQDCARWLPLVTPGGYALFHDYDDRPMPLSGHWAVRRAVDYYAERWALVEYYGGLLVKQAPPALETVFDVNVDPDRMPRPGETFMVNGAAAWQLLGDAPGVDGRWLAYREQHHAWPYWFWQDTGGFHMQPQSWRP